MKKSQKSIFALLLAICLIFPVCAAFADAAPATYTFENSVFTGMIYGGKPNGFGKLEYSKDGAIRYCIMKDSVLNGPAFDMLPAMLEETGNADDHIAAVATFADGKMTGAYYTYLRDGSWLKDNYTEGKLTEAFWVKTDGAVQRYTIDENGKKQFDRTLSPDEYADTDLTNGPMQFKTVTKAADDTKPERTIYWFEAKNGYIGGYLALSTNGDVTYFTNQDGDCAMYNAEGNYYEIGTLADKKWTGVVTRVNADLSTKTNEISSPMDADLTSTDGSTSADQTAATNDQTAAANDQSAAANDQTTAANDQSAATNDQSAADDDSCAEPQAPSPDTTKK